MEATLAGLYDKPGRVWSGMFYPTTLKGAFLDNGRFKTYTNITTAEQNEERRPRIAEGLEGPRVGWCPGQVLQMSVHSITGQKL